jgi:hypothetical protein
MITTIERYILESVKKGNKTIFDIHLDTDLSPEHIQNLLDSLIEKRVCVIDNHCFEINYYEMSVAKTSQKIIEFSLIIKNCIKNSFQLHKEKEFQMKKVFLNSDDEKVYQTMMYNLESFLNQASSKRGKTAKEKIIFWGEKTYQNIVSDLYKLKQHP